MDGSVIPITLITIIIVVSAILFCMERFNPYNIDIRKVKKQRRDHQNALEVYTMILESERELTEEQIEVHQVIQDEYIPHINIMIGEMDELIKKLRHDRDQIALQMMPR